MAGEGSLKRIVLRRAPGVVVAEYVWKTVSEPAFQVQKGVEAEIRAKGV